MGNSKRTDTAIRKLLDEADCPSAPCSVGDRVHVLGAKNRLRTGAITGESRDKECWYVRHTDHHYRPFKTPQCYHKSFVTLATQLTQAMGSGDLKNVHLPKFAITDELHPLGRQNETSAAAGSERKDHE